MATTLGVDVRPGDALRCIVHDNELLSERYTILKVPEVLEVLVDRFDVGPGNSN